MENIACIDNMSLINESNQYTEVLDCDSKNIKIIISLLSKPCSARELAEQLNLSLPNIELNLNRLMIKNVVKIKETKIKNSNLENIYELINTNFQLLTSSEMQSQYKEILDSEIVSNNICSLVKEMLDKIHVYKENNNPYNVKAIFIKVRSAKVNDFKKELNELLDKFESLEDNNNDDETFGLVSVLAPYNK